MEVYKILPEGTLAEVIDEKIYMSPSPLRQHQALSALLVRILGNFFATNPVGEIFHAPLDVYLDEERNAVQPDLFVVLNENRHIVEPKGHIHGVPDLVIEILSAGNRDHDLVIKRNLYEKFGVKEYFIADPETKEVIHYWYENGRFVLQPTQNGVLNSRLLGNSFSW